MPFFESELGESWHPSPDAMWQLRLETSGGRVMVENDMHRATAAIARLAATQGENLVLRKVRTGVYAARPQLQHRR